MNEFNVEDVLEVFYNQVQIEATDIEDVKRKMELCKQLIWIEEHQSIVEPIMLSCEELSMEFIYENIIPLID